MLWRRLHVALLSKVLILHRVSRYLLVWLSIILIVVDPIIFDRGLMVAVRVHWVAVHWVLSRIIISLVLKFHHWVRIKRAVCRTCVSSSGIASSIVPSLVWILIVSITHVPTLHWTGLLSKLRFALILSFHAHLVD